MNNEDILANIEVNNIFIEPAINEISFLETKNVTTPNKAPFNKPSGVVISVRVETNPNIAGMKNAVTIVQNPFPSSSICFSVFDSGFSFFSRLASSSSPALSLSARTRAFDSTSSSPIIFDIESIFGIILAIEL